MERGGGVLRLLPDAVCMGLGARECDLYGGSADVSRCYKTHTDIHYDLINNVD